MTMFEFNLLEEDDLAWFLSVRNQVSSYLHDNRKFGIDEAIEWYSESGGNYWTITDRHFGKIGYFRLKRDIYPGIHEIGADLDPAFHGKNLAFMAYREFFEFLRGSFGCRNYLLRVKFDNSKAINLYSRLGFIEISINNFQDTLEKTMILLDELPTRLNYITDSINIGNTHKSV